MAKRRIRVVYGCQYTKGIDGSPEYASWIAGVRQEFADLGWTLTSQGPTMSSTNVDEDELNLESDGEPLAAAELRAALERVGIDPLYFSGDGADSA